MPDTKITALAAITTVDPAADVLPIVDISDTSMAASGTTKKITSNQILGAGGTATLASATITGDLTVATDRLKVNTGSTAVQIGSTTQTQIGTTAWPTDLISKASSRVLIGNLGTTLLWNESSPAIGNASTLYIGAKTGAGATTFGGGYISAGTENASDRAGFFALSTFQSNGIDRERYRIDSTGVHTWQYVGGVAGTAMTLNANGLGIGVTPSAWTTSYNALNIGSGGSIAAYKSANYDQLYVGSNFFENTSGAWRFINNGYATQYWHNSGSHVWRISTTSNAAGANQPLTWTQAMTLDASGNLLVGVASGSIHTFVKAAALGAGILTLSSSTTGYTTATFYGADNTGANAANTALLINKNNTTGRSINAAGTINASGADYAEYMTKGSDFVLSKGGIAGIDANGKLTNVFADAVSFVVKSTDPSYVGNDKWGVGLEGDALEAARQLVDRIAFAGQVPVNVTGAKAGDYIVPVVDGTGIKGIAVSNPTFEQYQLAVGKVIAIDADGRARIIVKVA